MATFLLVHPRGDTIIEINPDQPFSSSFLLSASEVHGSAQIKFIETICSDMHL